MRKPPKLPGFVYLPSCERAAKCNLSEPYRKRLEEVLLENPEAGPPMVGTGGVRKLRFGREGEGKSGGLRVIYYYRSNIGRIYMIRMYPKNVQENLSKEVRNRMKVLTELLGREP